MVIHLDSEEVFNSDNETTGKILRHYRKLNCLSQKQLAVLLGFDTKTGRALISAYENDTTKIPREISRKLAVIFKLSSKYFYDDYWTFIDNAPSILKDFRKKNNISMTKAAKLIGTEYDVWSRWEQGFMINSKYYERLKHIL